MQEWHAFVAALRVGGIIVYPLLALAVVAMVVILDKAFIFVARARLSSAIAAVVEAEPFSWEDTEQRLGEVPGRNIYTGFLHLIVRQRKQPVWWLESRAADEAARVEKLLGRWLWVLETIVTAAPLLGLLGTISGMIRAFRLFGGEGLVDPRGVTGGVAEALIATAVGLFIALVALFAFNYFSHQQAQVMDDLERLGTSLVDRIRLEERTEA